MRFEKGDAVRMTPHARKMFPNANPDGVVTSIVGNKTVRVRRRGLKSSETWHESFWRLLRFGRKAR